MPTIEKLLDRLWSTPVGQEIIAQDAAEQQQARQAHIAALAELDKRELAEGPKLRKALAVATAKRDQTLEAVKIAQAEFNVAHGQLVALSNAMDIQRANHRLALAETAPECIDQFIARLQGEYDRLRRESPTTSESWTTNARGMQTRVVYSNIYKLGERLAAIGPSIERARALKHQDLDEKALHTRLSEIWASLPDTSLSTSAT